MIVIINIIMYKYMLYKLKENLPTIEILLGCIMYLYFVVESTLSIAILWLILIVYIWLLTSLALQQYKLNTFINILCIFGILISITLFFKIGVEQVPYPEGALIFHIEGITKALILFFVSSIPMIIRKKEIAPPINKRQHKRAQSASNEKNNNWEEATIEDLNSGQFEAI